MEVVVTIVVTTVVLGFFVCLGLAILHGVVYHATREALREHERASGPTKELPRDAWMCGAEPTKDA